MNVTTSTHRETENPIIDNRFVNDMTFAARLRLYLISFDSECPAWHEENRYLLDVANKLLGWQAQTATSEEEVSYLKQLGHIK